MDESDISARADRGDTGAMVELGERAAQKYDFESALAWYEKAAGLGDAKAMVEAGHLAERRLGDHEQARRWWTRAVEAGDPWGMIALAGLRKSDGDLDGALRLYAEAVATARDDWSWFRDFLMRFGNSPVYLFFQRHQAIACRDTSAVGKLDAEITVRLIEVGGRTAEDELLLVDKLDLVEPQAQWFGLVKVVAWISREEVWYSLASGDGYSDGDDDFGDDDVHVEPEAAETSVDDPFSKTVIVEATDSDSGQIVGFPLTVGGLLREALEVGQAESEMVDLAADLDAKWVYFVEEILHEHIEIWESID